MKRGKNDMSNYNFARMTDYREMEAAVQDLLARGSALMPAWDVYSVNPEVSWEEAIKKGFKALDRNRESMSSYLEGVRERPTLTDRVMATEQGIGEYQAIYDQVVKMLSDYQFGINYREAND